MENRLKVPRILWMALLSATFAFLVVSNVVKPEHADPPEAMLLPMLGALAIAETVASFLVSAQVLKSNLGRIDLGVVEEDDPTQEVLFRDQVKKRRVFAEPTVALGRALALYQTTLILRLAMAVSVSLLGFVLVFMGHPPVVELPFFAVTWILFALNFPRASHVAAPIEKHFRATLDLKRAA